MRSTSVLLAIAALGVAMFLFLRARADEALQAVPKSEQEAVEESPAERRERLQAISRQKRDIRAHLKKQAGVDPPKPTISAGKPPKHFDCLKQYTEAKGDRKRIYTLIAQHLRLAEALLEKEDAQLKRTGLGVIRHAAFAAALDLKDKQLTAAICDAWFVPNLELGDDVSQNFLSRHNMLIASVSLYRQAEAHEKIIVQARKWMDASRDNRNAADCARMRIGQALDALARYEEAIAILDEVSAEEVSTTVGVTAQGDSNIPSPLLGGPVPSAVIYEDYVPK